MGLNVTWLGHSTVVVDIDGVRVVADPLVRRNNGILRRRGDRPARPSWEGADAVLLSHLHTDHAEVPSLKLFPGVPVLTAPDNAVWVHHFVTESDEPVAVGHHQLRMEFAYDGGGLAKGVTSPCTATGRLSGGAGWRSPSR